jgi:hypothetical protein
MLFEEALKELVSGKYAARGAWDNTGEYVVLLPGMQYVWKIMTLPNPNAGNWLPLVADLQADDWKVVSEINKLAVAENAVAG